MISNTSGLKHFSINKQEENSYVSKQIHNNIINCLVINNKGKVILARQFIEMSKRKLFELTFLFDRNFNKKQNKTKNTFEMEEFFEIEKNEYKLRFTYQILHTNNLFLVLTTNANFNIFESLEINKIIHRKTSQICQINSEMEEEKIIEKIKSNAFEIILSMDDVINNYFGAEEKNLSQLLLNLKMESKEAEDFSKEKEKKEKKTREDLVKGIEEIERLKRENKYVDNSVSSEMFENNNISKNDKNNVEINQYEKSFLNSLNLKDRLIQKLIEHREEVFRRDVVSLACENMIKTMIMTEITRTYSDRNVSDDEEYEEPSGPLLVPLQIIFDSAEWDDDF